MLFKHYQILCILLCINISLSTSENICNNKSLELSVLATVFPPFTYFDSKLGFVGGVDILALRTIAERLNTKIVITKADNLSGIPMAQLK